MLLVGRRKKPVTGAPPEGAMVTPEGNIKQWHTITAGVVPLITMTEILYPSVYQGDNQSHRVAAAIGGVTFTLTEVE